MVWGFRKYLEVIWIDFKLFLKKCVSPKIVLMAEARTVRWPRWVRQTAVLRVVHEAVFEAEPSASLLTMLTFPLFK